jgi:hypothetical protein
MNVWEWSSPIGWAIFLVACGVTIALLAWAARWLSEIQMPPQKKK